MTAITPEVRADLLLLRQQTAEVRQALAHTHGLGAARSATVIRLRDHGVPFRLIAKAMGSSVAAVQGILNRADQRVTPPSVTTPQPVTTPQALGAGATLTVGGAR